MKDETPHRQKPQSGKLTGEQTIERCMGSVAEGACGFRGADGGAAQTDSGPASQVAPIQTLIYNDKRASRDARRRHPWRVSSPLPFALFCNQCSSALQTRGMLEKKKIFAPTRRKSPSGNGLTAPQKRHKVLPAALPRISVDQCVLSGSRRRARDVLVHLAWREGGYRLSDIGGYFGVGYTSVVNARRRAAEGLHKDRGLRRAIAQAQMTNEDTTPKVFK